MPSARRSPTWKSGWSSSVIRPLKWMRFVPALAAGGLAACTAVSPNMRAAQGRTADALALDSDPAAMERCGNCGRGIQGTPLGCAVFFSQAETVKELLAKGAKPDPDCTPILRDAAAQGRADIVRLLLDAGANPDGVWHRGRSSHYRPLFAATAHPEVVRMLLQAGADPTLTNWKGRTASEIARLEGVPESVALLEKASDPAARAGAAAERSFTAVRPQFEAAERRGDAAAKQGRAAQALAGYVDAYRASPPGHDSRVRLLAKVLDVARLMSPPPDIPDAARDHAARAQAFVKLAEDRAGFAKAAAEYEMALESAPWWAEAYYNLGLTQEKAGEHRSAATSLKRFLQAAPDAPEAADVKQRIVELEVAAELKGR